MNYIELKAEPIINQEIESLKSKCADLARKGLRPKMCVIQVGDDPASTIYIKNKEKMCQRIGAEFILKKLASDIQTSDFLFEVNEMNNDDSITGCFVQLPISKHLNHIDVTDLINPQKDIDGFHGNTIAHIYKNSDVNFIPCTAKGIINLFDFYNIDLESKHIVVIGRSLIIGKPISLLLNNLNATVTMCHSGTKNLSDHTKMADIIISAVGKPKLLDANYFKTDKSQTLIDVGINRSAEGSLCGDIDFHNVKNNVAAITPVPGGIGPLTVLSLAQNLVTATENILNKGNK